MVNAGLLALELIPLLVVGCIGPGLLIVRPLRWSPLEKLCGAIAASLILTYLAAFTLFCVQAGASLYWAVSGIFLVMGCLGWPQMRVILHQRRSRTALLAFAAVLGWEFLHLALSRNLGGGRWEGDWSEHYDRMRYFLYDLPHRDQYIFLGQYTIPARPPMMNVLGAFYCRQVGINFESFSLAFLVLNSLAFLPCCLLLARLGKRSGRDIGILAVLFMLNPSILQNATYTWTKALAAALVVLGVCFYLRAVRSNNGSKMLAAAMSLAAGLLVHYSAMPYCAAIAVHYVVILVKGRTTIARAVLPGICAAGLLATWFGWSFQHFGIRGTLLANTTAAGTSANTIAGNLAKYAYNTFTTLVPYPMNFAPPFFPSDDVRDYFFMMAQTTLTVMVGCAGGIVAAILLCQFFASKNPRLRPDRVFWAIFLSIGFALGIVANGDRQEYGIAHVTLQTLGLMGVTLVAAKLKEMNVGLFMLIIVGSIVDYLLGIFLNFDHRSLAFPALGDEEGWMQQLLKGARGYEGRVYAVKVLRGFTYWGDPLAPLAPALEIASIAIAALGLYMLFRWRTEVPPPVRFKRPSNRKPSISGIL